MSTKQLKCGVQLLPNWKGGEPIPVPNSTVCANYFILLIIQNLITKNVDVKYL